MKRIIKKNYKIVAGIIIGVIISAVGAYAATTISSSNISYDNSKSGLTSTNLNGAIDELYEKAKKKAKVINLDIGDIIQIGTEKFYVISYDDEYINMLTMYNLNVGNNWYNGGAWWLNGTEGIQSKDCTGKGGIKGQIFDYNSNSSTIKDVIYDSTCTDSEGYKEDNPVYFNQYKQKIENQFGIEVLDVRYLSSNDLLLLGCIEGVDNKGNRYARDCSKTSYSWLYSTSYFIGDELYYTTESAEKMSMSSSGILDWRLSSVGSGYRPVIKIKRSLVN